MPARAAWLRKFACSDAIVAALPPSAVGGLANSTNQDLGVSLVNSCAASGVVMPSASASDAATRVDVNCMYSSPGSTFFAALLRRPRDRSFGTASSTARAGGTLLLGAHHRTVLRPVKAWREPRIGTMLPGVWKIQRLAPFL